LAQYFTENYKADCAEKQLNLVAKRTVDVMKKEQGLFSSILDLTLFADKFRIRETTNNLTNSNHCDFLGRQCLMGSKKNQNFPSSALSADGNWLCLLLGGLKTRAAKSHFML
jgi:hypothetical protein